jgi:hypothetical protein
LPGAGNGAIKHWDVKIFEKSDFNLDHYSDDYPGDAGSEAIAPREVIDLTA